MFKDSVIAFRYRRFRLGKITSLTRDEFFTTSIIPEIKHYIDRTLPAAGWAFVDISRVGLGMRVTFRQAISVYISSSIPTALPGGGSADPIDVHHRL